MKIEIVGRHVEITPALRQFTEDRLEKLEQLIHEPLQVHVVLAIEKHRHLAEIQVKSRGTQFSGHHESDDLYSSIRQVMEKLERQALKYKEKISDHRREQKLGPAAGELEEELHKQNASSGEDA